MKKIANIFFVSFIVMIMILTTLFSYGGQIAFAEDNGDTNTAAEIIEVNTENKEDDLGNEIIPFEHDETETDDTEETDITEGEESNIIEYEAEPEIENNTENTDNGEEINEAHTDSIVVDTEWGLEMYEVGSTVKFIVSADETIISNDSVKWSVENHLDENTRITDDGILYISAAESSEEIKVTATSKLYENIKSSFNIKIVKSIDELMNLATTTELATEDIVGGVFTDIGTQEYLTGSNIVVYSGVTINNEQGILEGGYARVTVPKKYINGNLMVSTGATLLENPIVTKDSDNFYIQYKYIKLTGGTSSKIPFTFTTKNFTTPNNSTINIKQELFDKDGNIIDTKELEIINKASGKYYTHNDSFTFNVVKPDGETSLPADPDSNNSYVSHTRSIGSSTGLLADYNKLGVYNTQKAKIVLKLKDGIVFDPSYDPVNNDWTYDAANRTLTKIINTPVNNSWMTDKVSLKYPGFPINCGKWEDAYTSQIIGLDENGQELPDTASGVAQHKVRFCPVVLRITKTPASNNYIRNTPESGTYEWTVEAYSDKTDNITFYLSKIEDTDLNEHLYYTSVKIDTSKLNASEKEKAKTNILYGVKKDGTVEVVANNISIDEYYDLDENNHLSPTDVYRQIYVEFPDRLTINGGEGVKLLLKTKVFEKDWEEGIKDNPSYFLNGTKGVFCNASNTNNILYNYARASYSSSNNGPLTYTNKTNNWIRIYTGGQAYMAAGPDKSSLLINNEVTVSSRVTATLPMDNGKIFVLVPNGYTILENRTRISYTDANYTRITKSFTPEVIYDWNGTGKTGLIFDLTKINNLYNEMDGKARDFQAFVTLKTTSSTPEGISLVDYYSSWDNNTINGTYPVKNGNNTPVEDQYDLNKNGNTNDLVLYAKSELTFIPPREVIGIKTVGKTLDSMLVGKTGNMNAGDVVYYGINIKNLQKENTVRKLSVLDILPYNGDKNIVKNANGQYSARGSDFRMVLKSEVKAIVNGNLVDPATLGYKVSYSSDVPNGTNLQSNIDATFSDNVTDLSTVTMIKIESKEGTIINAQDGIKFVYQAAIPGDVVPYQDRNAVNTFAYASSNNPNVNFDEQNYLETDKTIIPIKGVYINIKAKKVWDDNNDEYGFRPDRVELYIKANGRNFGNHYVSQATNWETVYRVPKFDKDGNEYNYVIYEPFIPEGYEFKTSKLDDGTLVVTNRFKSENINKKIVKKWSDDDNQEGQRPNNVTFKISRFEVKDWGNYQQYGDLIKVGYDDNGNLLPGTVIDSEGYWTYDLSFPLYEKGRKIYSYQFEEVDINPFYNVVNWFMLNPDSQYYNSRNTLLFDNKLNEPKEVKGMVFFDYDFDPYKNAYEKGLSGIKVSLYSENGDKLLTTVTDENGEYLFQNRYNGNVYVKIDEVPDGYILYENSPFKDYFNNFYGVNPRTIVGGYPFDQIIYLDRTMDWSISGYIRNNVDANGKSSIFNSFDPNVRRKYVGISLVDKLINIPFKKEWLGEHSNINELYVSLDYICLDKNGNEIYNSKLFDDINNPDFHKVKLTSGDNWETVLENVRTKSIDGSDIVYSIREWDTNTFSVGLDGYKTNVSGDNENGFIIQNIELINVAVKKEWIGPQSNSVTINLVADNVATGEKLVLDAAENWEGKFTNLPKYKSNGDEIAYSVTEESVSGYNTRISGSMEDGFVVTNEKINVNTSVPPNVNSKNNPTIIHAVPDTGSRASIIGFVLAIIVSGVLLLVIRNKRANK